MKVVLLAGGLGTRLSEETGLRPKPMVEIGGKPILWHIMKMYSSHGFNEFVILLGYKGNIIKDFFCNYFMHQSDIKINMASGKVEFINNSSEPWTVTLVDTGINSMTGGRIKRARTVIGDDTFMLTYGDGVSDVDLKKLVDFHSGHGKALTMTSVQPDGRFGALTIEDDYKVTHFFEKPKGDSGWINGGFFVCEPEIFDYISDSESEVFEQSPLKNLANDGELFTYQHNGFWKAMDSLKDKNDLNDLWNSNQAPWRIWV